MRAAGPSPGSEPARRRCQGGYIGSHDGVPEAYSLILPDEYVGEPDVLYRSVEDDLLHGPWVHVTERGESELPLPPLPPVRQAACHDLRACARSSAGWTTRRLRRSSPRTPVKRSPGRTERVGGRFSVQFAADGTAPARYRTARARPRRRPLQRRRRSGSACRAQRGSALPGLRAPQHRPQRQAGCAAAATRTAKHKRASCPCGM